MHKLVTQFCTISVRSMECFEAYTDTHTHTNTQMHALVHGAGPNQQEYLEWKLERAIWNMNEVSYHINVRKFSNSQRHMTGTWHIEIEISIFQREQRQMHPNTKISPNWMHRKNVRPLVYVSKGWIEDVIKWNQIAFVATAVAAAAAIDLSILCISSFSYIIICVFDVCSQFERQITESIAIEDQVNQYSMHSNDGMWRAMQCLIFATYAWETPRSI